MDNKNIVDETYLETFEIPLEKKDFSNTREKYLEKRMNKENNSKIEKKREGHRERKYGLSSNALKIIAMIAMALDHHAVIVINNGMLYGFRPEYYQMAIETEEGASLLVLYHIFRFIGRIAFPIFAFLLVEGFIHTRNFRKYLLRMLLLACISEPIFDIAIYNQFPYLGEQNVCFTLSLGLITMYLIRKYMLHPEFKWFFIILSAGLAELLNLDYGAYGIMIISLMYMYKDRRKISEGVPAVLSAIVSHEYYGAGVLAFPFIHFYSGRKGRMKLRWIPYIFYPLHMLIFFILIYIGAMLT